MRTTLLACIILIAGVVAIHAAVDPTTLPEWQVFQEWTEKYGKVYSSQDEAVLRFGVFTDNLKFIEDHNIGSPAFTLSMNQFGDLTAQEYASKVASSTNVPTVSPLRTLSILDTSDLPRSVNWVSEGVVTPVKDMTTSGCAAAWAYAAVETIESAQAIATNVKPAVPLSVQNVIDCSYRYGNDGCRGGRVEYAYDYVLDNAGINDAASYPISEGDYCRFSRAAVAAAISTYHTVPVGSEAELLLSLATVGPVAAVIDASSRSFQFYAGGIYRGENTCGDSLSSSSAHAVVIVGYGVDEETNTPYWLVKNVYGAEWGVEGYMRIARSADCGLTVHASYPMIGGNAFHSRFGKPHTTGGLVLSSGPSGETGGPGSGPGSNQQSSGSQQSSSGIGSESSSGAGSQSSGIGSQSSGIGSQSSGIGSQSSGIGSQSSGIGSESSGMGSESSGIGSEGIGSESSGIGGSQGSEGIGSEGSGIGGSESGSEGQSGSEGSGMSGSGSGMEGSGAGAGAGSGGLLRHKNF